MVVVDVLGEKLNTSSTLNHWTKWGTCFIAPPVSKDLGHLGHRYVLCSLSSCYLKLLRLLRPHEGTRTLRSFAVVGNFLPHLGQGKLCFVL